ncbi:Peptidase S10 [Macleaya cordata]|uniref:Carboxypeptidase n=1 Tax=Macleaya cordata TaxID=56857 RepID=A0A200QXU3_MACCD|nr:Peptidase S10 [Macleaya cordata]
MIKIKGASSCNLVLYGSFVIYYYLILIFSILVLRTHADHRKLSVVDQHVDVDPQEGLKEKDRITELLGQPGKVNFGQYGGYVTVDKNAGRAFFYYFVEADGPNKDSAPLLLWLNGGPGCSSVGLGAMTEIGPFRVKSDGKTLFQNIFAWNKVANVLFLDSPTGIGFSYSNTTSDTENNGDARTAADGYSFLLNWLERFPEYKNRDFYISGESYGGHYVPQLADTILQNNKLALSNKNMIINLKGISIGNPSLDKAVDDAGTYEFLWSHALISDNEIMKLRKDCNFSQLTDECIDEVSMIWKRGENYNEYNIYAPVCHTEEGVVTEKPNDISILNNDPCSENYVLHYMNLPEVQLALHANVTKLNYTWELCSTQRHWKDSPSNMIPVLQNLLTNGLRVLVYSGDFDSKIPYGSTIQVLKRLNLTEKVPWNQWNVSDEIGGSNVEYNEGLTFSTVRGAGHMVPRDQPERALTMIKCFLQGEPLPKFVDKPWV